VIISLEFSFVPFVSFVVDFDLHFCPSHPPGRMPFDALHAWSVRLEASWAWQSSFDIVINSLEFSFVPFVSFVVDFDLHFCPRRPRRHTSLANRNSLSDGHILARTLPSFIL
jgi:hypothetical protein